MKILTTTQIKEWDKYTIEHEPVASIDLMERAARALTDAIKRRWSTFVPVYLFAGPGNNGGDTLAIARMLSQEGYKTYTYLFNTAGKLSVDCAANKERLRGCNVAFTEITTQFTPPQLPKGCLVVDGLFGSGLNKPLNGGYAMVVKYINQSEATVVSIDVPSGLMCEDNSYNVRNHIIQADVTLTLQKPKLAFLFAENQEVIGELEVLDIHLLPQWLDGVETPYRITEAYEIQSLIRPRKRFAHKGDFGHALLIAGKYGMAGASVLAAKACLRCGVGLLTVHTPTRNNDILQTAVPEAILEHDTNEEYFTSVSDKTNFSAVAIGPGIGQMPDTALAMSDQIKQTHVPLVLDADALNILGVYKGWLQQLPKQTILTPHPKEFERLVGSCNDSFERLTKAKELAAQQRFYIILKGAWTAVVTPEGNVYFNPTGNPGMATAGSGDVLTGVLLALVAQGYTQEDACRLGVYLHGLAGDIAAAGIGEVSMTASDLIDALPKAWMRLTSRPDLRPSGLQNQ